MPSIRMRMVATAVRLAYKPRMATEERARRRLQAPKGDPTPPDRLVRRHDVTSRPVEGFTCYSVAPRGRAPDGAVLYLHGGAYVAEATKQHWALVDRLVADVGCAAEVPLYGLAPDHTHHDAWPLLDAVYQGLLERYAPDRIVLAGDSAGAGLALAFAQALLGDGRPRPGRLLLIAPWLDITLSDPAVRDVERHDPWLTPTGLRVTGAAWAGDTDHRDARVSPLHGPMAGLPPIDAYIGTRDVFHPDTRRLARQVTAAGGTVDLHEADGAIHVYPLTPTPEGRAARDRIVATLRRS